MPLSIRDRLPIACHAKMVIVLGAISLGLSAFASDYPEGRIVATDGAEGDHFGASVAIDGCDAIIGADSHSDNAGAAYFFRLRGEQWLEVTKVTASDVATGDRFGSYVSISRNVAIVGVPHRAADAGAAYIFARSGSTWLQAAKLTASDAKDGDYFGNAVSISGDVVVVGAPHGDGNGNRSGAAYVFERRDTAWIQVARLFASDAPPDQMFGCSASVSGQQIVVGACWDDDKGVRSGAAYVYGREGATWRQIAKLTSQDGAADDRFGLSVSMSGSDVVVGTPLTSGRGKMTGSAYVFKSENGKWRQVAKLKASDEARENAFGAVVHIAGEQIVVSAPGLGFATSQPGSAYVFRRLESQWKQIAKLTAEASSKADDFATCVANDGRYVLVGASSADDKGPNSGTVFLFQLNHTCSQEQQRRKPPTDDSGPLNRK